MTSMMTDKAAGVNADVIRDLRELADFLEQHPALPPVRATAWVEQYRLGRDARADLTALAEALGERATEDQRGSEVEITGHFGEVRIRAVAKVHELSDEPAPLPEYEPIIGGQS